MSDPRSNIQYEPQVQQGVSTYIDPMLNKTVRDLTDRLANVPVPQSGVYTVIEDDEEGFLIAFSITVDDPHMIMEVVAYGDDAITPIIINNLTMHQLLRLGWGLTPGDVEVQPDGDSQDKTGDRDTAYPWLERYKLDDQEDMFGETNNVITLKYTPSLYHHYKRLVINVKNASSEGETANIIYLSVIRRIVYDKIPPGGLPTRVSNRGEYSNIDMEVGSYDEYAEGQIPVNVDYKESGTEVAGGIKKGDVNKDYETGTDSETEESAETVNEEGEKTVYHQTGEEK